MFAYLVPSCVRSSSRGKNTCALQQTVISILLFINNNVSRKKDEYHVTSSTCRLMVEFLRSVQTCSVCRWSAINYNYVTNIYFFYLDKWRCFNTVANLAKNNQTRSSLCKVTISWLWAFKASTSPVGYVRMCNKSHISRHEHWKLLECWTCLFVLRQATFCALVSRVNNRSLEIYVDEHLTITGSQLALRVSDSFLVGSIQNKRVE